MSVENIIARIMADAETQAAETKAHAEKRASDFKNRVLSQAKLKIEEIAKQADFDIEELERRRALIVELENRKSLLAVRRQVLDQVFALAEQKLLELDIDKREALLTRYIMAGCENGDEQLCIPVKDRERYKSYFLAKLNVKLEEQGKMGKLSLAEEAAKFSGGVLIIGKDGDYDASFAAILRNVRAEHEKQTADILFAAEV